MSRERISLISTMLLITTPAIAVWGGVYVLSLFWDELPSIVRFGVGVFIGMTLAIGIMIIGADSAWDDYGEGI